MPQPSPSAKSGLKGPKPKDYFNITATLVLLIVLLLLIFPAIKHISLVNREISDARIVKKGLEEKVKALALAKENYEEVVADLPILSRALPVGSDLPPYLKTIENLAANNGLTIAALSFLDVPLTKPGLEDNLKTNSFTYGVTLAGGFPEFKNFLTDLEKYIRTTDVLSTSTSKDPTGVVKHIITANGYYIGISLSSTSEGSNPTGSSGGGVGQ